MGGKHKGTHQQLKNGPRRFIRMGGQIRSQPISHIDGSIANMGNMARDVRTKYIGNRADRNGITDRLT